VAFVLTSDVPVSLRDGETSDVCANICADTYILEQIFISGGRLSTEFAANIDVF